MAEAILSIKNIVKKYPGVVALNNVSVDFQQGEVHALLGENGAGKSTLIKILTGAEYPNEGAIYFDGQQYDMTPALSTKLGVQAVYQELNLLENRTVYENVFLGKLVGKHGLIDKKYMQKKTIELFQDKFGVDIDPNVTADTLSIAYKQMIEINKAVLGNVKVLILDEPTASLTDSEVKSLFEFIKKIKTQGVAVVFITHRIDEIFTIADKVTVLRDGQYIATHSTAEVDRFQLVNMMVGRELQETYPQHKNERGEVVLEVSHLSGVGFADISFQLHKGEILGFSGLIGAGRTELAHAIFGVEPALGGTITVNGQPQVVRTTQAAIDLGIGLIPEDRKGVGLQLGMPITSNVSLPIIKKLSHLTVINKKKELNLAEDYIKSLSIRTPSPRQIVRNLSGGNQQKVVLARWLATESNILIFDEPTRGIDVGAKQEIYKLLCDLAEQGHAIILISSDMEEILGMADRIIVLCEGRFSGEVPKAEFSAERLGTLASGITENA